MGAEIDRLEIAIESQAKQAASQIDLLYDKLGKVSNVLNRTANGYRNTAREVGRLAASMQALARVRFPDYSRALTQLTALSKLSLNALNKKITVDIDVNAPKSASQIKDAIERSLNGLKLNGSGMAESLISEFSMTGGAAQKVKSLMEELASSMAQGFDSSGELRHVPKRVWDILSELENVIIESGSVVKEGVERMDNATLEEYERFARYMHDKSIYLSKDLRGALDTMFKDDLRTEFPALFSGKMDSATRQVISLEKEWEGLVQSFPNLLSNGFFAQDEIDRALQVVQALRQARDLKEQTAKITALKGNEFDNAAEAVTDSIRNAVSNTRERLTEGIRNALAETSKQLTLDIEVNQEKIVRDIKNAINTAATMTYDPIKIKLDTDKSSIKNQIRSEIASMDAGSLPDIAKGYNDIASALASLANVQGHTRKVIKDILSLTSTDMSGFDASKLAEIAQVFQTLGSMRDVSQSVNRLVSSLTRLATSGPKIEAAATALPQLSSALQALFTDISGTGAIGNADVLISSISRLASASTKIGDAAGAIPSLTAALKDYFNEMANAPIVSENTLRMTEALATMSVNGRKVGSAATAVSQGLGKINNSSQQASKSTSNISSAMSALGSALSKVAGVSATAAGRIVTSFSLIGKASNRLKAASSSLAQLLKIALGFYGVRTLFNWGKQAVELSSDLTEVQNVVENSFGTEGTKNVEQFAETSIESFGMAELAAKQFSSRFQAMGNAMGITSGQIAKATQNVADRIADVDNGSPYDKVGKDMGAMALNLTKLTADMASFYNVEQETVAEAMNAVYTGQTRPLRRYGLDLTQATLQEWANKQGIDAKVQSMTQAEKTLLRYQYVMANTTSIQGDFTRTAFTWANQIRVLRQNIEVLAKTIGNTLVNALRPAVIWLNNVLKSVIAFAETVGNALGKIFGWEIYHTPASNAADAYDTLADQVEDVGTAGDDASGGLDKATKAAEKLKRTILGFDELNVLNGADDNSSNTSGSGSGSGAGTGGGADTGDAFGADFQLVQADSWIEKYKSDIDTLEELGGYIGEKLKNAMDNIPWDQIYQKASGFGSGLASFLNGLFEDPEVFGAVGRTIAGALNTVMHTLDGFGSNFNWTNFGKGLGTGIRNFFNTFDWQLSAKNFSTFVNGIFSSLYAAAGEIPFGSIGFKIGDSIRRALAGIEWEKNVFPAVRKFGSGLAEFLNGLFASGAFEEVAGTITNELNAALEFLNSFGETFDFDQFARSIATGINKAINTFNFKLLADALNTWALRTLSAIKVALKEVEWDTLGEKVRDFITTIKWAEILDGIEDVIAAAINGCLDLVAGLLDMDGVESPFTDAISNIKTTVDGLADIVDWEAIGNSFKNIVDALKPAAVGFAEGFISAIGVLAKIGGIALNLIGAGLNAIASAISSMDPVVVEAIGKALGVVAGSMVGINLANGAVGVLSSLIGKLTGAAAAGAGAEVVGTGLGKVAAGGAEVSSVGSSVAGALDGMANSALGMAGAYGAALFGSWTLGSTLQSLKDSADGGNGKLFMLKETSGQLAKAFLDANPQGEDLDRVVKNLAESCDNGEISFEEFRKKVVKAFDDAGYSADDADQALGYFNLTAANMILPQDTVEAFSSIIGEIGKNAETSSSQLDEDLSGSLENISDKADDADTKSGNFKTNFWKMAAGAAGQALLMAVIGGAFSGIGKKADDNKKKVGDFGDSFGDLNDEIKALKPDLEASGTDTVQGLYNSCETGMAGLAAAMSGWAGDVNTAYTSAQGINSPSTVWYGFGENTIQGLINGIASKYSAVKTAINSITGAIDSAISTYKDTLYSKGAALTSELESGMKSVKISLSDMLNLDTNALNQTMKTAGSNAASYFASAFRSYNMPTIQFYISSYKSHDTNNDGYADYYSPIFTPYWYAMGGFPNKGELFYANEAGPEMVGRMGHKNVVANNMQITEGIKAAVVDGMMEVAMATGNGGASGDAPYVLNVVVKTENDEVLARAVERGRSRRDARFNTVASPI